MQIKTEFLNQVCLPGDILSQPSEDDKVVKIGPGIILNEAEDLVCTKAGILRYISQQNKYYIETFQQNYIPMMDDFVIGVIKSKGEIYKVDIQGPTLAILNSLAFDGATKRNRPNLHIGSLVYCRVLSADRHLEACELTCQSVQGTTKKDWVTKESIFGELTGGYVMECAPWMSRKLLQNDCPLLQELGQMFNFEIAVGVNGRVWISCDPHNPINTSHPTVMHLRDHFQAAVFITNTIQKYEKWISSIASTKESEDAFVKEFLSTILKQNIASKEG